MIRLSAPTVRLPAHLLLLFMDHLYYLLQTTPRKGSWTINPKGITRIEKGTALPLVTTSGIWEKEGEIATASHTITTAPVDGNARMVKSRSNPLRPHLVQVPAGEKIVCDENCPTYGDFTQDLLPLCSCCSVWFVPETMSNGWQWEDAEPSPTSCWQKPSHRHYLQRKITPTTISQFTNNSTTAPPFATVPPFTTVPLFTAAPYPNSPATS